MKYHKTTQDKWIDNICRLLLFASAILILVKWNHLPEQIPIHYTIGSADSYGQKWMIWLTWLIAVICYIVFQIILRIPMEKWNVPVKVTEQNRNQVFGLCAQMIQVLQLEVLIIFLYILLCQCSDCIPGIGFLLVSIFVPFGTCIGYFIRFCFLKK